MTDTAPPSEDKLNAMLDKVRKQAMADCQSIEHDAEAEAADIVKRAHADARAKVHGAIEHERAAAAREIERMYARIDTDKRQRLQNAEHAFLDKAWAALLDAVTERWRNDDTRRAWVGGAINATIQNLQPGSWRIEHPKGWDTREIEPFANIIEEQSGGPADFEAADDIRAGLRINAGEAVLDATEVGVLVDQGHISAMMLAELFKELNLEETAP